MALSRKTAKRYSDGIDTFPDIPLSTLRLLDESSMTEVQYQFRFHAGTVYAIVGFRKFGGENPIMEDLFEEND
uniref:HTH araC/xylS-type domain-containing protein n=1 Tax=Loa loa TaxID=7209 RepID=A0A1I7VHJ0_LOALO